MRVLLALIAVLPAPALAQAYDLYNEHRADGSNGAVRLDHRLGTPNAAKPAPGPSLLVQPANSGVHVYQPRSLNDVAKDWAKAHPDELPNRRKQESQ
jgi:hypothetical protein